MVKFAALTLWIKESSAVELSALLGIPKAGLFFAHCRIVPDVFQVIFGMLVFFARS